MSCEEGHFFTDDAVNRAQFDSKFATLCGLYCIAAAVFGDTTTPVVGSTLNINASVAEIPQC